MRLLATAALALLASCHNGGSGHTVLARLTPELAQNVKQKDAATVDYVVGFKSAQEASAHVRAVVAAGGQAEAKDPEGRLLRVRAPRTALGGLDLADSALVALNSAVHLVQPVTAPSDAAAADEGDPEEAFLTARAVSGVTALTQRFPAADGHGMKVAIFDTGIDFGVQGVSDAPGGVQKLLGFYDLTNFGRVKPTALVGTGAVEGSYTVGGKTLTFAADALPQAVTGTGVLDEAQLGRDYLAPAVPDLNGDGTPTVMPYVVGVARDGAPAVWVDANGDGILAAGTEELTDFNTTHKHIDLMPNASPSGAHGLAVTIRSGDDLQFHSIQNGHGTSCAIIVAGDQYANGRLRGMAPKAQLYAYVLDTTGQDVYTVDQFLATFAHAKAQGVDAISISWGFSTADLASSRFIGDWLDREIAGAGIIVGIAAGNGGPGVASASPDDYVPHNGYAVGAAISEAQAHNVYGWTGEAGDGVIYYSSFGPTAGGRQVPDVVSPIMTLVRNERGHTAPRFYAFSGTSSATPALIGSLTALSSALHDAGEAHIDTRLLKLAVQASAHPVAGVPAVRQGAGLLDVNAAFDIYQRLAAESRKAAGDAAKSSPFAYDLRAETALPGSTLKGEGLHFKSFVPAADVRVVLTPDSQAAVDALTFVEAVRVVHSASFLTTPDVVALQASGTTFTARFSQAALATPGVYSDVLELRRVRDDLPLLRVPVVFEIPAAADGSGAYAQVDQELAPFAVWRQPVVLQAAEPLRFDGVALDLGGNRNSSVAVMVVAADGRVAFSQSTKLQAAAQTLAVETTVLPAGSYEVLIYRSFGQPAALGALRVAGAFHRPLALVRSASAGEAGIQVAVESRADLKIAGATLTVDAARQTVPLERKADAPRQGYYGAVTLPGPVSSVSLAVRQSDFDRQVEHFLNVELAAVAPTGNTLLRGWYDLGAAGAAPVAVTLPEAADSMQVVAYPNIVNWDSVKTRTLFLDVEAPLAEPLTLTNTDVVAAAPGQIVRAVFAGAGVPAAGKGKLTFSDQAGTALVTVPVTW